MSKKLISLFLTIALFTSFSLNSYAYAENAFEADSAIATIKNKGSDAISAFSEHTNEAKPSNNLNYSSNWEDYIGDLETFAYGLTINQLQYSFDVFPGSVDLADGNIVYGIAYTDYSGCYTNEEETMCYFDTGFIPFNGEITVPQKEFDSGLFISNLDFTDDHTKFIWTYGSEPFKQHCVVYNQYLQYGVNDKGYLFYNAVDYIPGICDESIGSLYSYDEAKYLLDFEIGTYLKIAGVSLYNQLDFAEIEKEINEALHKQEINFSTVDVVSCAGFAQEAIVSYLLSLQEETFLGFDVKELVSATNSLDPMECYRITAEGLITIKLDENTKSSELTKWLVGTGCVILTAVALLGSVVFIECPPLSALAGAVAGTAIEVFIQVVITEKDLECIDWRKVAIGAAAGAVSGFLGPYIAATGSGFSYILMDSAVDGLIGGIERAAEAWIDGKEAEKIIQSFGYGAAMGFVLSAGFKGIGNALSKAGSKIGPGLRKITEKLPQIVTKKLSVAKKSIGSTIYKIKEVAENSIFHSQYISKKIADKQMKRLISKNVDELMNNSINNLSVENMIDISGNRMTKETLKKLAAEAKDGAVLGYFKKGNELIQIVKKNSMVSIVFDPTKYQTIEVPGGLTIDRSINFENAAIVLKEQWLNDPSKIPDSIATAINNKGLELEELMPKDLVNIIQSSNWVIHENMDRITATLAPRLLHKDVKHMGGVGLAKYLKSHMGIEFFDRLVTIAATGSVIAVN